MFYTKPQLADWQTPEQRAFTVRSAKRRDDARRALCNMLGFWRTCDKPLCRRSRTCSNDMHACFERRWALMPEHEKEWIRGALLAKKNGARGDELGRAADARRAEYLASLEKINAPASTSETPAPTPEARIRRL